MSERQKATLVLVVGIVVLIPWMWFCIAVLWPIALDLVDR